MAELLFLIQTLFWRWGSKKKVNFGGVNISVNSRIYSLVDRFHWVQIVRRALVSTTDERGGWLPPWLPPPSDFHNEPLYDAYFGTNG